MSDDRVKLETELAKIEQTLAAQERLRGVLPDDQVDLMLSALKEKHTSVKAQLEGSGAIALGAGAVAAGASGTAIGTVQGNVYVGPPPKDCTEALVIYHRVVAQVSGQLPLRGVDVGAADPTTGQKPVGLANVYVDLDTTIQVPLIEVEKRKLNHDRLLLDERDPYPLGTMGITAADSQLMLTGEEKSGSERLSSDEQGMRPLSAVEAVIANRRLVLLGDPGGGKSTFINHLAHCLTIHTLQPDAGWLDHLPGWSGTETEALPIIVILRDFARGLPDVLPHQAEPRHLWNFIVERLKAQNLILAAEPIRWALEKGQALVLLDGLDEVSSMVQRVFVRDAVTAFVNRYPDNRYLITCRALAYQPPATRKAPDSRLIGFPTFELASFGEQKVDKFITAWYGELARIGVVRSEDAGGLAQQLQSAVRRLDLWRLASNPLLLTVMALVHTHKGRLPDARAMLYEDTVDILLWRWEQVKAGTQEEMPRLQKLLLEAGRTDVDLKRTLWQLAYEAHAQVDSQIAEEDDQDMLADIGELKLEKSLVALKDGDHNWARQVMETIKLRAGLLLERAPEVFTFPHRTFQEYLAGAHLASQADFARRACKLAEQGMLWREVILLAVGRLVHLSGDTDKPLALVGELCLSQATGDEASWSKAWLAGDVLLTIGTNRVKDSALGRELLTRVRMRLADLLAQGQMTPRERAAVGDSLARLGDPRKAVTTLDKVEFCFVPAGPFYMGSEEYDEEKPLHLNECLNYDYWISRYPVTVAQFCAFVEASGRKPADKDSLRDLPNRPVAWVSWHEAQAFCNWLTQHWQGTGILPEDWVVHLPSEAEWEKAMRGGVEIPTEPIIGHNRLAVDKPQLVKNSDPKRLYPWGNESDPNRANYDETGIGTTSAVGCFPEGSTPYGCLDMAGNAWEWTRSLWGKDWREPDFGYPYGPKDGREDLAAGNDVRRVLRGGAFDINKWNIRCTYRDWSSPLYSYRNLGFRIVASPYSGSLTEKREQLYVDTLDLLRDWWESPKTVQDQQGTLTVLHPSLAEWLKVDQETVRVLLNEIAYRAHARQSNLVGTADVLESELVSGLLRLSQNPDVNPAQLAECLNQQTGLLLPRGERVYTFPHRTFQEYLTACYLANHEYPDHVANLARHDPKRWWKVALLAGIKATQNTVSAIWQLVEALCYHELPSAGQDAILSDEDKWGALLAAQVLLENEQEWLGQTSECNTPKLERVRRWIEAIVAQGWLQPVDRTLAGEALAVLGDDRDFDELVTVPAGPFLMGDDRYPDASPQHEVMLPTFKIGKYLVTNAQYLRFVEATGRPWSSGDRYRPERRNCPVVDISWHDARAYCAWLTGVWRAEGKITGDEVVRLPTETEWEKAARGRDGREYPWGKWAKERCNTNELGLGATCAVGMFPDGASPYSCLDMAGQVWEWTTSLWGEDWERPIFKYPYDPTDGRESLEAEDDVRQVLRGGSFFFSRVSARCADRYGGDLKRSNGVNGFRVVVSPL